MLEMLIWGRRLELLRALLAWLEASREGRVLHRRLGTRRVQCVVREVWRGAYTAVFTRPRAFRRDDRVDIVCLVAEGSLWIDAAILHALLEGVVVLKLRDIELAVVIVVIAVVQRGHGRIHEVLRGIGILHVDAIVGRLRPAAHGW